MGPTPRICLLWGRGKGRAIRHSLLLLSVALIADVASTSVIEMLDQSVLRSLRALGQSSTDNSQADAYFEELCTRQDVNVAHWNEWEYWLKDMSPGDIALILKGLTLAERHCNWYGGSVAASIWVFRILYRKSDSKLARSIADWIAVRTANSYSPYGTTRHRSFDRWVYEQSEEYRIAQEARQFELKKAEAEAIRSRMVRLEERQAKHHSRCEQGRLRSAERLTAVERLRELPLDKQLDVIATRWDLTLDYWPVQIVQLSDTELKNVPRTVLLKLRSRLSGKCQRSGAVLSRD